MGDTRPEKIFRGFGLLFGLVFLFLTPPFQVPDELVHFFRAYQVSRGELIGTTIPASMSLTAGKFDYLHFHSEEKTSFEKIYSAIQVPLAPQTTVKNPTLAYPPLAYLPQAIGVGVGTFFEIPPVLIMYLGRYCNLMIWLFLVGFAIRRTPIFKWLFCLLALSPMSLFEAASLSRDPFVNAASLLLVALILDAAYGEKQKLKNRDLLTLFLVLLLASLPKSVYAVLGMLFLIIPISKIGSKKKYFGFFVSAMVVVMGLLAAGNYFFFRFRPSAGDFSEWRERAHFIFSHPFGYLEILLRTCIKYGGDYVEMFIGVLGWVDTALPRVLWIFYGFVLMLVALLENENTIIVPRFAKIIAFAAFLLATSLTLTIMYLSLVPVDGAIIGMQGRYFIPLAPLLFLQLYNHRIRVYPENSRTIAQITITTAAITLSATSYVIFARYYL